MTATKKVKIVMDFLMTSMLPILMAYEMVGKGTHEWMGILMFIMFLIHHALNRNWHKNLLKGRYTSIRALGTIINVILLMLMLVLMVTGIILSKHVFVFLNIRGGISFARILHLASSYWCFVLSAVHLGFHWGMLLAMARKALRITQTSKPGAVILRMSAIGAAGYGIYAFCFRQIGSYMFLQSEFVFFDFTEPLILFFVDYIAVMSLFATVGHYSIKALHKKKTYVHDPRYIQTGKE